MATVIMMKNPQTGAVTKGFYGFSWTSFFFGGFPALFRGDAGLGLIIIFLNIFTFGIAGIIWAFIYNKKYTINLLERGYHFAGSEAENEMARSYLGVGRPVTHNEQQYYQMPQETYPQNAEGKNYYN